MNEIINNQYRIIRKLGEGGMGSVFLAEDILLKRLVAIKSLNKPRSDTNEGMEDRFQQEALALARLNHPNITHVYTFVQYEGTYWMVMEYVEGRTLEDWIRQHGIISTSLACSICTQVLNGLHHAHNKGIIHRDLKPANIMISIEGEVKIMDFGIARIRNSQRLTQHGKSVGTLEYMAPEQIQGKEGDELTDVYAAGNMLYEMLNGETPFKSDTDYQLMKAKLEQRVMLPPRLLSHTQPSLQQVISKSLERNPEKRYPDVLTFREELKRNAGVPLLSGQELYNALHLNSEEFIGAQNEHNEGGVLLQRLPGALSTSLAPISAKLRRLVKGAGIVGWKFPGTGGRMDKSVKLLIAVVVVCVGLVIWNLNRQDQAEDQSDASADKVNYSVNLDQNNAPASGQSNIIEHQLIENRSVINADENLQSEGKKQETPPETNTPREKINNPPKGTPKDSRKTPPPTENSSLEDKANSQDGNPVNEEKPKDVPASEHSAVVVPEGLSIRLILQDDLSSEDKSKDGHLVKLTCAEDIKVKGQVVIPQGAVATGKIVDVAPSAKRRRGLIGFVIVKVVARDGTDIRLASERFRLKSANDNEPAIFRTGKVFVAKIHKERLVR